MRTFGGHGIEADQGDESIEVEEFANMVVVSVDDRCELQGPT